MTDVLASLAGKITSIPFQQLKQLHLDTNQKYADLWNQLSVMREKQARLKASLADRKAELLLQPILKGGDPQQSRYERDLEAVEQTVAEIKSTLDDTKALADLIQGEVFKRTQRTRQIAANRAYQYHDKSTAAEAMEAARQAFINAVIAYGSSMTTDPRTIDSNYFFVDKMQPLLLNAAIHDAWEAKVQAETTQLIKDDEMMGR